MEVLPLDGLFELCMCSWFSKFVFALVSIKEAEEFESYAKCSFYFDSCVCSVFFLQVFHNSFCKALLQDIQNVMYSSFSSSSVASFFL